MNSTNQKKRNSLSTPKTLYSEQVVDAIVKVLANDDRVIFAYLYGSMACESKWKDIGPITKNKAYPLLLFKFS